MNCWFTYFEDVLGVCQAKEHSCQANKGKHHITKALEKKFYYEMVFTVSQQFYGIGSTLPREGNTKRGYESGFESLGYFLTVITQ